MSSFAKVMPSGPNVAFWAPVGRDAELAAAALRRAEIVSTACSSLEEVCEAIGNEETGSAVLAEEALTRASIDRLQDALAQQPPWSDLPLILLTGGGNSTGASLEKLSRMRVLGNITLLERPLRSVTLVASVQSALASRRRQFETRDFIRELQEAQAKLGQANSDLKQFAFAASHDLQEPLRMVNIFTQLLLDRHIDSANQEAQQFAGYVRSGVTRMEVLLRDLLHYSRAIHEEREWPHDEFELGQAIVDATEGLRVEIDSAEACITVSNMPIVRGDRTQLSLVFQNLISNAIKYARPGVAPAIKISCEQADEESLIRVQDNGSGFEERYAERVFELFQRLSGKDVPGTGLGLAICRRIVERHGGRMWAESELGVGSTFLFTIPRDSSSR